MYVRRAGALLVAGLVAAYLVPGPTAAANPCPPGLTWKAASGAAAGQSVSGYFTSSSGRCVGSGGSDQPRNPSVDTDYDPTDRRFINCLLAGISRQESEGGYLDIEAPRTVDCPDPDDEDRFYRVDPSAMVRSLIAQLRLPDANPRFGPNPNKNEWKMLAVGFPVWLWTDGPRQKSTTASASGITFNLSAELESTTFTMGDGGKVTCTSMSTYSNSVTAGAPSPTCGYVYKTPSLPRGTYTVTATPTWRIRWSAAGFSGTLTTTYSDSSQIRIGELSALNR